MTCLSLLQLLIRARDKRAEILNFLLFVTARKGGIARAKSAGHKEKEYATGLRKSETYIYFFQTSLDPSL